MPTSTHIVVNYQSKPLRSDNEATTNPNADPHPSKSVTYTYKAGENGYPSEREGSDGSKETYTK